MAATSDIDVLKLEMRPFIKRSITTAVGTPATLVDASLTEPNDFWNGMAVLIRTGACAGEVRRVLDWDLATHTLTVNVAFTAQIVAEVAYVMTFPSIDPVIPHSTDESGSFLWDTSEYGTAEQDISALFTTPLTGTTRRKYSVFLDLTGPAGDAAAWTKCTVKVKVKIDGTNYRTVDKKEIAKTDVAAAAEPGVNIDIPAVAQDVQITFQFDVALGADQTIYYHYVREALE